MESNKEYAFNMKASKKLTREVCISDTGASCHMKSSIAGMFDLKPGSGGIKARSGKILKIVKIGKFRGEVTQKDGSTRILILNNVHFVPDLYCNLFSITSAMVEGFKRKLSAILKNELCYGPCHREGSIYLA